MTEPARVLVADDEESVRDSLSRILAEAGHDVDTVAESIDVIPRVRERDYDLLLVDLCLPPTDGIAVLEEVKRARPSTLVVIFSGVPSIEAVLRAFRNGAFDFLVKPIAPDELRDLARRAVRLQVKGRERRRLAEELEGERLQVMELRRRLGLEDPFARIVGSSRAVHELVKTLREVARTDSTVLLTGESGTGKGLVARVIHEASSRRQGPFVEANCVVYSEGVLHSELFGHERGAFTGADKLKRGRFEMAEGGTIFLDEIGEISSATQLLLLRVLQDRSYERVGGEETLSADARLIAATNQDLAEAIRRGVFREDLYYRLNVIPVHLPPLRERIEDLPALAQHFAVHCAEKLGRPSGGFTAEALETMMRYDWPGNARELENMVERLVVLNPGERIGHEELPPLLKQPGGARRAAASGTLQDVERQRIAEVLREAGGNKKLAARRLGIHRSTLYAKLRRYGLDREEAADPRRATA